MRKEAVQVTPGAIIAPGIAPAPGLAGAQPPAPTAAPGARKPQARTAGKGKTASAGGSAPAAPRRAQPIAAKTDAGTRAKASRKPAANGSDASAAGAPPAARKPTAAAAAATPAAPATPATPAEAQVPDSGATRRNFFRLDVFNVEVVFELEGLGGQAVKPANVRGGLGDVSGGGLRLTADADAAAMPDWPVRDGVTGRLHFSLLEEDPPFDLPARLVRRAETTSGYELAFTWTDPPQPEIDRLVHALYQLEVRRRAAMPEAKGARGKDQSGSRPQAGHRSRQPLLIGAALGLGAAVAVFETVSLPAVAPVLGVGAVIMAAAYLLVG